MLPRWALIWRHSRSGRSPSCGNGSTGSSSAPTTRQTVGGRYISEATEARDRILREWDTYTYRLAYDHLTARALDTLAGIVAVGGHLLRPGGRLWGIARVAPGGGSRGRA